MMLPGCSLSCFAALGTGLPSSCVAWTAGVGQVRPQDVSPAVQPSVPGQHARAPQAPAAAAGFQYQQPQVTIHS